MKVHGSIKIRREELDAWLDEAKRAHLDPDTLVFEWSCGERTDGEYSAVRFDAGSDDRHNWCTMIINLNLLDRHDNSND